MHVELTHNEKHILASCRGTYGDISNRALQALNRYFHLRNDAFRLELSQVSEFKAHALAFLAKELKITVDHADTLLCSDPVYATYPLPVKECIMCLNGIQMLKIDGRFAE